METNFIDYLIAGQVGVMNMIIWGIYGDLLAEKFSNFKVLRSLLFAGIASTFLFFVNKHTPLFIIALTTISFERFATEIYKAFIRDERQGKYLIPSDWNINWPRPFEKFLGFAIIFLFYFLFTVLNPVINNIYFLLIVGFISAIGGAAKDAPYEGFQLKFFRSPLVTIGVGLALNKIYPFLQSKYFILAVLGGERIISEFYKKILNGRVPGKFKTHKLDETWKKSRKLLLISYVFDLVLLIYLIFI